MGVILQFMPLLTRRGIFFSATVDPDFPPERGRSPVAAFVPFAGGALDHCCPRSGVAGVDCKPAGAMLLLPLLLLVAGSTFSYWLKFREVHQNFGRRASDIRYAELNPQPQTHPFSLWLCAPPFVWLAGVAFYLQAHWYQLPERFPVHWGADGQPNGWATRSFSGRVWSALAGGVPRTCSSWSSRRPCCASRGTRQCVTSPSPSCC